MSSIDKLLETIEEKMNYVGNTELTLNTVYESIIEIYPKFNDIARKDENIYKDFRKVIIDEISNYYDNKNINKKDTMLKILQNFIIIHAKADADKAYDKVKNLNLD